MNGRFVSIAGILLTCGIALAACSKDGAPNATKAAPESSIADNSVDPNVLTLDGSQKAPTVGACCDLRRRYDQFGVCRLVTNNCQ